MSDLRVFDAYEKAMDNLMPLRDRQGNWVQKFQSDEDALLFAAAQFSRYQEVEAFVKENFAHPDKIREMTMPKESQT